MCRFIDVLLLIDESIQKYSNTILQICRKTILITVFFTVTKVGTDQEFDSKTYKTTKREYKTALVKAKKHANENFINSAENKSKGIWNGSGVFTTPPNATKSNEYLTEVIGEVRQNIPQTPDKED